MPEIVVHRIPPLAQFTVECELQGNPPQPRYLGFVKMIDVADLLGNKWKAKVGGASYDRQPPPQKGLHNSGFYTYGLGTCVSVAMTFFGQERNYVTMVHLSNLVVLEHNDSLVNILSFMYGEGTRVGRLVNVVLGLEEDNLEEKNLIDAIVNVLTDVLNIPTELQSAFIDTRLGGGRAAVNAVPQNGTWALPDQQSQD